jgi:probable F420-dependent oxidoreductase
MRRIERGLNKVRIGVVFPQTEIGPDPAVLKDYAQAAEALGYDHLLVYDHVLGAGLANRPGWRGAYSEKDQFHEPFVFFGYLAGLTSKIELVTGVLVLPQRQTALVAKQAAEVDVLTGGRLRLGVGVGWNDVEYVALGENFHDRGERIEEQIAVLRALWAEPVVDFKGRWHTIPEAGLNPIPIQRPIPIWIGGTADVVLRRTARLGDGWFPMMPPNEAARLTIEKLRAYVKEAGRDPSAVGIDARFSLKGGTPESWRAAVEAWRELGATHLSINTMGMGLSPREHIAKIEEFMGV